VTKFCAFWDSFESAIHNNGDISSIDKFNYLKVSLESSAARGIQGLALSASNYESAVAILKTRFERLQQIISHMNELLKLPLCTDNKSLHLRQSLCQHVSIGIAGN